MAASIRRFRLLLPQLSGAPTPARPLFSRAQGKKPDTAPTSATTDATTEEELDVLPPHRKMDFDATSLAARGYLRSQKPYTPPSDALQQVLGICQRVLGTKEPKATFPSAQDKWKVLVQCSQALSHKLPNSIMHRVTSVEELVTFYLTPVNTTVPLDMMKDMDLPKNLHVIYNYTRFHPETDTMFEGVSVFTKDSTIVVGLKNKKRYPGFEAKDRWPYH